MSIIPEKLRKGDETRVISPSRSLSIVPEDRRNLAVQRLKELGFDVTFSEHAEETDEFRSSPVESRIEDLHAAFSDKNVRGILTTIGGFNSNQLLKYIDYDLIQSNPKVLCGYSDITALSNAIHAKTGLITYSGPHFSTFGMLKGLDYTIEYFKKCLMEKEPFEAAPSKEWSDDKWYIDQKKREFIENSGFRAMNTGEAKGKIIGGNLSTFNLLQGTEFMPDLRDSILFLEDDSASNPATFDRGLQSILHLPEFEGVKCLAIGRFQKESGITKELLEKIIRAKKELSGVPVVSEVDFGHTSPQITFPIGGTARISAGNGKNKIEMLEH